MTTHRTDAHKSVKGMTRYNAGGPKKGNPVKAGSHRKTGGRSTFKDSHRMS